MSVYSQPIPIPTEWPAGYMYVDTMWRFRRVDPVQLLREGKQTPQFQGLMECYPGLENAAWFPHLKRAMEQRTVETFECVLESPQKRAWYILCCEPVPQGFVLSSFDITERKKNEEAQLSQLLFAIGQFTGKVAHDLKNLLSVILSYSELALDELDVDNLLHGDLQEIHKAGRRGCWLSRQLLAFRSQPMERTQTFHLNHWIKENLELLQGCTGGEVELDLSLTSGLGSIQVDASQLEQAMMMLSYFFQTFGEGSKKLFLKTDLVDLTHNSDNDLGVKSGRYASFVMANKRDNFRFSSPGDKLQHYDPTLLQDKENAVFGLGVMILDRLARQMGGALQYTSSDPSCAQFRMYLPLASYFPTPLPAESQRETLEPARKAILLVEDDDSVRQVTERVLEGAGYEVVSAVNGEAALLLWEQHRDRIDLLLSEALAPPLPGRELAVRLSNLKPELRVILMSRSPNLLPSETLHPFAFIEKPFTNKQLCNKLQNVLSRSTSRLQIKE